MRPFHSFAVFSILSLGIVHCVADEPDTEPSNNDGGDGGSGDAMTSGDATTGGDASNDGSTNDAGVDAAFVDTCVGFDDCPSNVQSGSLQLWLRGGIGETCVGNQLTLWHDNSGSNHNATPTLNANGDDAAVPPQCDVAKIGSNPVVTFTAPTEPDAGKFTEYVDGTLDVELDTIENSDYTVIVVHERSVDAPMTMLATDRSTGLAPMCHQNGADPEEAFFFGFDLLSGVSTSLGYGHGCANGDDTNDHYIANTVEADTLVFSHTSGHQIFRNGVLLLTEDGGADELSELQNPLGQGSIGRAVKVTNESRYRGNMGEIIVYNTALAPADLTKIYAHLTRQWGITF